MSDVQVPLWQLSAVELVDGFRQRLFTPCDALESVRQRCERVNPDLNAVVKWLDEAGDAAQAASARYVIGMPLGPLDGVPISIKDNLCVAGTATSWGTPVLAQQNTQVDELPVAKLRAAGMVIFAKTNVPEFTLEGYTDNPVYGVTRNPWDLATTPGGSSGGAAAAVAAGIGPLALGTDGGGSIRRPAAHTHLFGLKPGLGSVARGGGLPQILLDMEVVGPLARHAEDLARVHAVLSGPDVRDARTLGCCESDRPIRRILAVKQLAGAPVDRGVAEAFTRGVEQLRAQHLRIEWGDFPLDLGDLNRCWSLVGKMGLAYLADIRPEWMAGASKPYQEMAEEGAALTASDLWQALEVIGELRNRVHQMLCDVDAILMPSIAAPAWQADRAYPCEIEGQPVGPRGHAVFTGWVNAAGAAAINLPLELPANEPRAGMQLIASSGRETALLALAERYQDMTCCDDLFAQLWRR